MLISWVVLILLVIWVVRTFSDDSRGPRGPRHSTAMQILEERFARGEIDRKEFEERRSALESR
jgi:putative membrane protein